MIRPRMPAFSHGFISFLWGFGLGAFVGFGLLSVGASAPTSFFLGIVAAFVIFFYVRLYGGEDYRR